MNRLRAVTATAPRAVIYLRQSTYREESISLELQELACRDYCDRQGYTVTAVESDPGISGRTWKRPAVQRTMDAIENHTADVVVLWKWSRLSRSRKDWALAADRVDVAGGRIESATEPIDTATASGRFARGVMTEYAAFQSEQIGEQWEEVRQRRLRLGLPASGRLPFGWRWIPGGIEQHPDQAPYVIEMYRRYLAGEGSAAIARWLNEQGVPAPSGRTWTRVRPFTVMDSPIHAGLIPYRGSTHPGAHAALIDESTWRAYQDERAGRRENNARHRDYDYLLSSLVWCACGQKMVGKGAITGGRWYGGYICTHTTVTHPERAYISARTLEPVIVEWATRFNDETPTDSRSEVSSRLNRDRILRDLNALEEELAALTRQLAQGIVPEAAYLRARTQIEGDSARLNAGLRRLESARRATPDPQAFVSLRFALASGTVPEKNRALRTVIARIDVLPGGGAVKLTTTWAESSLLHL